MPARCELPKDEVLKRYLGGESMRAIAKSLGRDPSSVRDYLDRWGVAVRTGVPVRAHDKEAILSRYADGESIASIAESCGRSYRTMHENLSRWGAEFRRTGPPRTYTLDETFFDVVDTEAKAYWLGFLLADVRNGQTGAKNWVCRLDLASVDREHVAKFAAAVGSDAPIKDGHAGASAYVDICSASFSRALCKHGVTPDKTGNHGTPRLRKRLMRHLYRGAFDGDGSLYCMPTTHSWRYELVGAPTFVAEHQDWLVEHAGVSRTKLLRRPPIDLVRYTGGTQIERIMRLLYRDATVYLDRKFRGYQELLRRPTD